MKDQISIERIKKLHPKVRATFTQFIEESETKLGVILRVSQGLRTIDEQNQLYAQGRTKPGKIVTNAKGGSSYHNYGLAIDLVELKDGKVNWDFDYSKLKVIADKYGIVWGGTFKSIVDKPHFEISFGFKTSQLLTMAKENGYVIL